MKLILFICCLAGSFYSANGQACPPAFSSKKPIDRPLNKDIVAEPTSSPKIFIRCGNTINSETKPLVVIDGILMDEVGMLSLNPADIEEIHVLKDAAAAPIFSCRSVKPVIVITTKKARHRSFKIKDATNLVRIPAATIRAVLVNENKSVSLISDQLGRIETDSLKSVDYLLTISAPGFQTKTIGLKQVLQNKGVILLEPVPTVHWISRSKTDVSVYPNPVNQGASIQLSFPNAMTGIYHIRLLNSAGQLFYSFQKQIVGKGDTEQIKLGTTIGAGIYLVQILDEKKKLLQSSKLIVQ